MENEARLNLICHCYHAFREHVLKRVAKGTVGGECMMAGCPCRAFVLDDAESAEQKAK